MKKKTIKTSCLLLCFLLIITITIQIFAGQADEDDGTFWDLKSAGIGFNVPREYQDAEGVITYEGGSEIIPGSGIYLTSFWYAAMTQDDFDIWMENQNHTPEEIDDFSQSLYPVAFIFSIKDDRTKDILTLVYEDFDQAAASMTEAGKVDDCTFYILTDVEQNITGQAPDLSGLGEYEQEYLDICSRTDLILDNMVFSMPKEQNEFSDIGRVVFETTDIYGNPVTSDELFSKNTVTMINIWTSWCTYCVMEMPELEKLYKEFQEKNCGIIGLLYDGTGDSAVQEAKNIISDCEVTYPVILPFDGFMQMFPVQGFPTSLFVDSEGNVVGSSIIGADIERYPEAMKEALEEVSEITGINR